MSDHLCLLVEVPVCAFRPYTSREYQDTYPVPAPSSVYGMLLSLIGVPREEKDRHRGAALAFAVESLPQRSHVFRKLRRGDDLDARPDYQDLLTDMRLWIWLAKGDDAAEPSLVDRVRTGLREPTSIHRSGGLSLGESSYLVDAISICSTVPERLYFILPDDAGFYSLPVWVNHVDAQKTVLRRFRIDEDSTRVEDGLRSAWFGLT